MGYVFQELYLWPSCPLHSTDLSVSELDDRMREFHSNQEIFAERYDLSYLPLVPSVSKHNLSSNNYIRVNLTHLSFRWGLEAVEISFYCNGDPPEDIYHQPPTLENTSNFGYIVGLKQEQCGSDHLCHSCRKRNIKMVLSTLRTDKEKVFQNFLQHHFSSPTFTTKSFDRILDKDTQLILDKTTKNGRAKVYLSLLWTTSSLIGVNEFGTSLVIEGLNKIPQYRTDDNQDDFDLFYQSFENIFLTIYFWLHPDFLTEKHGLKLGARTLEINSFLYVSRSLLDLSFWSEFTNIITILRSSSPIITSRLYDTCMDLPNNLLGNFIEQINVLNLQMPSYTAYRSKLTIYQQKILEGIGKYILETYHAKQYSKSSYQEETSMTLSEIRQKSGYTSGSMNEKISIQVKQLVDRGILIKIEKAKTRAKYQYYLNPEFPYTQLLLSQLS